MFCSVLAIFDGAETQQMGVELYMGSVNRFCYWMDTQDLVVPVRNCKAVRGPWRSSCSFMQECKGSAESSGHISFDDALLGFVTVFQVASMDSAYAVIHTFLQSEPAFKLLTWLFFIAINALFSIIAFNM